MTLFYFDVYDNGELSRDEQGCEFATIAEARRQAIGLLPNLARDALPDGDSHSYSFVCVVRDAARARLYRASLTFEGRWTAVDAGPEAGDTAAT